MKPRMKKWLAALLSVGLLAGSLPVSATNAVYAAEEQFTGESQDTPPETVQPETGLPEKTAESSMEETADAFTGSSDTAGFTSGDSKSSTDSDFQDPNEDFTASEEETISGNEEVSETDEAGFQGSTAPADLLDADAADEGGYLEHLAVYTSQNGNTAAALTRAPELDADFGGKVYTTEYGSNMDSASFWITADLAQAAPEGSVVRLEATGLDGQKQTQEMDRAASTNGTHYSISTPVFAAKENGSRRAVYTITAGTEEDSQTYTVLVLRRLDLSSVKAFLPGDTDLAKNILPKFDTTGTTRDYEATVAADVSSLHVTAAAFADNWYHLSISSTSVDTGTVTDVPFSQENPAVDVPLSDTGDTRITLSMEAEGTYTDPVLAEKTYTSTGTYQLLIHKGQSDSVTFQVTPEDAVVSVYDKNGDRLTPSADSLYTYNSILQGETYNWNVSRYGYVSTHGSFTGGSASTVSADLVKQEATQPEITDNDWISFRNSESNNGITGSSTPVSSDTTLLKWAYRIGVGEKAAITPPLILGGYLYVASGQFIYKLDKNTGEIVSTSQQLSGNMQYAMIPLTYAEGMLFAQIGKGQIQAVSATSLKSLWISESLGGQTLSPITYKDGYLYTGTWNSETTAGSYFCLSVTDEDPSVGDETKYCTWKYNHKGGFYWAGAYASADYLVFGSDDGSNEGTDTDSAILYSVSTHSGLLLDKLTNIHGDIRSTVVYHDGYIYFTTKGGYLYRVQMQGDGTFGSVSWYNLGGMATASPVVYKGRIYVGVCGKGGQFNADGGHHFDVLTESASGISLAYSVSIPGYPQAAPLLSTAYENQDFNGDGMADGRVYLYFTYNAKPGGIYMLTDEPGQTSGNAKELFRPTGDQQEYCISTICTDREGTLYYKNDSNYLMALETNGAYLDSVTATADTGKVTWPSVFRKDTLKYDLTVPENTSKVTFSFQAPDGCALSVNGQACQGSFTADISNGAADVKVTVTGAGKSREYQFHLAVENSLPVLANMTLSTSNAYANTANHLALSPAFNSNTYSYRAVYKESREFLNIFAEPADSSATVTATGIRGTSKVTVLGKVTGSGQASRIAMYFDKADPQAEAEVQITVTTKSGKQTTYTLVVQRTDTPVTPSPTVTPVPATPTPMPPKPTETPEVFGPWTTVSAATVFAPETQKRTSNKGNTQTRTVGNKLAPTIKVTATSIRLKVKQSTSKIKVTSLANGDSVKSWSTSNRKIASVTNSGTIKGLKAGKAKITVTLASGKKQVITVTVQKTAVKTIKITGIASKATLKKGKKLTLKPVISPITSLEKISYTSSNKKVAAVSKKGVITAKKKGTATITVKSGSKSKKIKITVK